jgi:hypothetical protein
MYGILKGEMTNKKAVSLISMIKANDSDKAVDF